MSNREKRSPSRKSAKPPVAGGKAPKKPLLDKRLLAGAVAAILAALLLSRCLKEDVPAPVASVRPVAAGPEETQNLASAVSAGEQSDEEKSSEAEGDGAEAVTPVPPGGVTARFKTPVLRSDPGIEVFIEGVDENGETIPCELVWRIDRQPLADVSGPILPWEKVKRGDRVSLLIIPQGGPSKGRTIVSEEIVVPNSPPRFTSMPMLNFTAQEYVYQARADDADADPLVFTLEKGPTGMTIDSASGRLVWQVGSSQAGEQHVKVVVNDPQGGRAEQEYTLSVEIK